MRRLIVVVCCFAILPACDRAPPSPVTVYVPTAFAERANAWLPKSGLAVTVVAGDSAANTDLILAKKDSPRADVLVTSGVVDIWYAADNGALRPISGETLSQVPGILRDPDGLWVAMTYRHMMIGVAPGAGEPEVQDLRALAAQDRNNQVCLSSSALEDNRALISMLIAEFGNRPAERIVRGWVHNLAKAPFATETELVDALRSGECRYGIISSAADTNGIDLVGLPIPFYNIEGMGVARHAQYPEAAQQLVDWVLAQALLESPPASNTRNVGQAGWYDQESVLLAERAGYR